MAWAFRAGLVSGYWLMPSIGFLGRAAEYRPDNEAGWTGLFLRAVIEAAEWGLKLESHLRATHHRLLEMAARARTNSRMMPLADLLISRPAVSAKTVAQCLGLTPHGARAMLLELEELALIREMSGRKSYRNLYGDGILKRAWQGPLAHTLLTPFEAVGVWAAN